MSRVSYVMMNPGGRDAADGRGAAGSRRAGRRAHRGRRRRAGRRARPGGRRQPDHAPPRARHRSDAARHGAVHARHRPARRRLGDRHRSRLPPCPPARAAVHRRTRRRRHRRGDPRRRVRTAATTCSSSSTSGPTPRSCSGTASWLLRGVEPDRSRVRGRADLVRPARDAGRHRTGAHRPRHARTARQGDRHRRRGRTSPAFEASLPARRRHRACAVPGIIEVDRRAVPGRRDRRRRHHRRRDAPIALRRVVPDGRDVRVRAARRGRDRPALRITQNDVRAIQLAKAALQAGVRLLMDHAGLESLTDVGTRAAGRCLRQPHRPAVRARARSASPTAIPRSRAIGRQRGRLGRGAGAALRRGPGTRSPRSPARSSKIETAIEPAFQEHFVAALAFPHATDPYPHLAEVMPLPARRPAGGPGPAPPRAARRAGARSRGVRMTEASPAAGAAGPPARPPGWRRTSRPCRSSPAR